MTESELKPGKLRHGDLAFSSIELGEGPIAICLHGFPDHPRTFEHQLPALAAAGFRAVAPTMRGYEPSSQPRDRDYHMVRMAEDVVAWIDDLGVERVHLIGHDWGAVASYAVAALAPERFMSLTTIAVAHPKHVQRVLISHPLSLPLPWYMLFFQIPGLAERTLPKNDWAYIEDLWRRWSPGFEPSPKHLALVKQTLGRPGVKQAALGYYRSMFDLWSRGARETMRLYSMPIAVPTLAITGARDGCIASRVHDLAMREQDFTSGLTVRRIEGAGHFVHLEKPQEVNDLVFDFIQNHH